MMRLYKFAPLAILFSITANAAPPVITGATGASAVTLTGTPVIWGGFVGTTVAGDGTNPVNTCATVTGPQACNLQAIYNTLVLRVTATHTDAGKLLIVKSDRTLITNYASASDAASITWDTLCSNFSNATGNCDTYTSSGTGNFKLLLDKNQNGSVDADEEAVDFQVKLIKVPTGYDTAPHGTTGEGLTSFTPYPGDEKVYIEDPVVNNNSMSLGYGSKAVKLRVFMSPNNMTEAAPNTGLEPVDLPIQENSATLDNSIVDGLTNGQAYFFRVGMVDEAGNLVLMFPATGAVPDCDSGNAAACPYAATPDEVIGLLTEDMNCFVATAAYGSALEPKLDTFREFRFKQLLPHKWGRSFVKWYYHYGPYLARYIHDKPMMRASARVLLWPAYGFTRVALSYGIYPAMIFTLAILSLLVALPFIWVRK